MITKDTSLPDICFAVCTALKDVGITAVLCGGSAATFYAPAAYQSHDADFVITFGRDLAAGEHAMTSLGYMRRDGMYVHPENPFTVEFPAGPLGIGDDLVRAWSTITSGSQCLYVVTATDCVRDRLSHFYYWNDFKALAAAVAVATEQANDVDLTAVKAWTEREDPKLMQKFGEFERRLREQLGKQRK